jgi:hypothetical protein
VPTARLERNYNVVRAALQRARFAERAAPPAPLPHVPWWRRPVAFASMSVPAGAFVLAVLGASGAAAAFATTPLNLSDVLPDEVAHVLTIDGDSGPQASATHGAGGQASLDGTPPGVANGPALTTITGSVSGVSGNTFLLTSGDDEWKVNIDSQTLVDGVIAEGATAEVTGDVTAEKNMHAGSVDVLTDGTPEPTKPGNSDETPGPDPDKTTGPDPNKTTGPDPEKTPGPPDDVTQGPPQTPPAQSGEPPGQDEQGSSGAGPPGSSGQQDSGNDGGRKKP